MPVVHWAAAVAAGVIPALLAFMALRALADGLFLAPDGPTWPWILLAWLAQFAWGLIPGMLAPLAAPAARRADVAARISAAVGLLGLLAAVVALVFGSSIGRVVPSVGAILSFVGAVVAAFWWAEKARTVAELSSYRDRGAKRPSAEG